KLTEMGPQSSALSEPIIREFMDEMLAQKQYAKIVEALPKDRTWLKSRVDSARQAVEEMHARARESPREAAKVAFIGTNFATNTLVGYFEAFVGAGRPQDADYLISQLLCIDKNREIRTSLTE